MSKGSPNKVIGGVSIDANLEYVSEMLAGVENGVQRAVLNSFNRALLEGRTAGIKEVRKKYAIKAGDVRQSFSMHKATTNDLNAELWSRGEKVPLRKFRYNPKTDTTGNKRKQVRVSVLNEGGLKPLGKAFVWKGKVMQRLGETSRPVREVLAVPVPVMLNNDEVSSAVMDTMQEAYHKRIDHEVNRILNGYEGKSNWR